LLLECRRLQPTETEGTVSASPTCQRSTARSSGRARGLPRSHRRQSRRSTLAAGRQRLLGRRPSKRRLDDVAQVCACGRPEWSGAMNSNTNPVFPAFVFTRQRHIEIEAGFTLAGKLFVDMPKPTEEQRRMFTGIVRSSQRLRSRASGRSTGRCYLVGLAAASLPTPSTLTTTWSCPRGRTDRSSLV
jgi:hypothetical protein